MKKLSILFLSALFASQLLLAQTVDEAKNFLNYGRIQSAQQTLNKLISANSKNGEAIYWLGQSYLQSDNINAAKKVYQDALNAGVNDPLVWVGMGHVELLQGQKDAARQRFEAAITNSTEKKKRENVENVNVLNAIGRANADGASTVGDPTYAIEKLKRAVQIDPNNVDAYINLGINYLKLGTDRGGDAYEAFTNALRIQPTNARAKFRLGKIFQSQGNAEKYLDYYNQAVSGDAAYAPAYLELYNYYANRDVNKAREYLDKYVANSDKDCNTEYFYADYLFRSGKYQESLDRGKQMLAGACKDYPRLKVLFAYNYDRLGDSAQARSNIESFLSTTAPEKIQPDDYLVGASILKKFTGAEETAIGYLKKALDFDTVRANRFKYMDTIASLYKKSGKMADRLDWLKRSYVTNPSPSNLDIYNIADAAINARQYNVADTFSRMFIQKYPDQEYGYALLVRNAKAADVDSTKGSAFDEVEQYITFLKNQDSVKNMSKIKTQYYYIASVSADKMKDYRKALDVVNHILALDPQDAFATQAKGPLERAISGPSRTPAKQAPAAAPKQTPAKTTTKKGK